MTTIVILAAGSSSRMGQPKQNLVYEDKTLLQRIAEQAKLVTDHVLVILGAGKEVIIPTLQHLEEVITIDNAQWVEGTGSSIRLAIEYLLTQNNADQVLFTLCDQPYVNAELLKNLITTAEISGHGIIACHYSNTIGVPALFNKKYFPALLELQGQEGAKKLFEQYADDVQTIPFPQGAIDIDTEEDFRKLKSGR